MLSGDTKSLHTNFNILLSNKDVSCTYFIKRVRAFYPISFCNQTANRVINVFNSETFLYLEIDEGNFELKIPSFFKIGLKTSQHIQMCYSATGF